MIWRRSRRWYAACSGDGSNGHVGNGGYDDVCSRVSDGVDDGIDDAEKGFVTCGSSDGGGGGDAAATGVVFAGSTDVDGSAGYIGA